MEGLSKLLSAQSHLMQASSDFFDACAAFRSDMAACPRNSASHADRIAFEGHLDKLKPAFDLVALVESRMHNSRTVLNWFLNESVVRVPIGSLPSEILSRIFAIAVSSTPCFPCFPSHYQRDLLLDIPRVCTRWRQVAINTRSLWSHIDVRFGPSPRVRNPSFHRLRIFTDRCRGMPIHLHLDATLNTTEGDIITEFISALQPHAASLSSLILFGEKSGPWAQALFTLCSSYGAPDTLKTLVILEDTPDRTGPTITLPTYPFQALGHLELKGPKADARISLGELVTTVSNCPRLHALLLTNLWIPTASPQEYSPIHLPCLRLLQIRKVYGNGTAPFVSMLHPDKLELDVRLDVAFRSCNDVTSSVQSLLTRSNVVSLTVDIVIPDRSMEYISYISSVPCLRALLLNVSGQKSPDLLDSLLRDSVARLPRLQSLCLMHCDMRMEDMDPVKWVVQSKNLRTVGFLSCNFPLPPSEQQQNYDNGEDSYDYYRPRSPVRHSVELPKAMREWLSERVGRVIVGDVPPTRIHDGVDLFVQELTSLG